ncbi:MAG: ABC transporter substrate-binding protein [Pirellulales bacterium]|nr:ABC transporter substrate-binding protein [Pirellulales bacterium]
MFFWGQFFRRTLYRRASLGWALAVALVGLPMLVLAEEQPLPVRLLDRVPFDRITLDAASGGHKIDILLLSERHVPNPLPVNGDLEVRRLSQPSVQYTIRWASIAQVEFFEQLLLKEARRLTATANLDEAYEYLYFLAQHYSHLEGLAAAQEKYLVQDAGATYRAKRYDESLTVLLALYNLNPRRVGLEKQVEVVSDLLIQEHLSEKNFTSARGVLKLLQQGFPQLGLENIATWQQKFQSDVARQLALARRAMDQGNSRLARQAVRRANGILPENPAAMSLVQEINQRWSEIVVGVSTLASETGRTLLGDWTASRIRPLMAPQLVELVDFGAEGGIYRFRGGELASDDSGLGLEVRLDKTALAEGITPERIAVQLLRMSDPASLSYQVGLGGLLKTVGIDEGQHVQIKWHLSHVRPEALLQMPLEQVLGGNKPPLAYHAFQEENQLDRIRYSRRAAADPRAPTENPLRPSGRQSPQVAGPKTIIERVIPNEQEAIDALLQGDVDALDRIPPWQVERLRESKKIIVDFYRLPTVHVLIPNYANPLLGCREFRRALCYGIDRKRILNELILGGQPAPGFGVLSGPLPRGSTQSDPIGYAYDPVISPLPYEPRLAAVLAKVARLSVAKKASALAANTAAKKSGKEIENTSEKTPVPQNAVEVAAQPLVLAFAPDALARSACQTIKRQLDAIGIPIELRELAPRMGPLPDDYDLFYTDLAIWEPLVDARQLLGPHGRAGNCSAAMSLALERVDRAQNWKEARTRLQHVHQISKSDLPVIPLWQTINAFAYRQTLQGIGKSPVSLYQNLSEWKVRLPEARGAP